MKNIMKNQKPKLPPKKNSKSSDVQGSSRPKKTKVNNVDMMLTPDRPDSHTINWFPGHMAKAIAHIKLKLASVDIVLEVRDARIPLHTTNSALDEVLGQKGRIIIFNKANLVEPNALMKWDQYFKTTGLSYLFINCLNKSDIKQIIQLARDIIQARRQKDNPGVELTPKNKIKMMVIGLPNTGKSTLINQLAGRSATKVANKPGQTQVQQLIKVGDDIELLDTPGIMMPSVSSFEHGIWLTLIHAIPEDIVGIEKPVQYIVDFLKKNQSKTFMDKYGLKSLDKENDLLIEEIAKSRGCIKQKGLLDLERAYRIILTDFRNGDLGHYTFGDIPK